jgi:putative FmdB family regulatory protein
MPIYVYACDTCQSSFERKQKFSDEPVRTCPECGNEVRRVLFPAGIIFKGSGFYVTDNRASNSASTPTSSSNGSGTSTAESSSSESSKATSTAAADN